jgi:GTP pyrophosphokinase
MNTKRYMRALAYATKAHGDQVRKGTDVPYIIHPIAVSTIVFEYGGTEDQAIAALLHDVVEDCGGVARLHEIRDMFGPDVADIVEQCSDSFTESKDGKEEWRTRKERHTEHLMQHMTRSAAVVIAADKLHNLRAIRRDLRIRGAALWDLFQGGQQGTMWYYARMIAVVSYVCAEDGCESRNTSVAWNIVSELDRVYATFPDVVRALANIDAEG